MLLIPFPDNPCFKQLLINGTFADVCFITRRVFVLGENI